VNFFQFFTDPVLRAPTIGSMLMCLAAALVGVLVFVRKRSLLGEALSHATYPGVTFAIICAGFFTLEEIAPLLVLVGAFFSSLVGFWVVDHLEKKVKVPPDAALGTVLALFFGVGVTVASFAQNSYPHLYRQMQSYLYGQAATMTDRHLVLYGALALMVLLFITLFYKEIVTLSFDFQYARTNGIAHPSLDLGLFLIAVLALVIGVRCVGVVLMSAMLITPAVAARQFTNRLSTMFLLAGLFGSLSAFLGVYCSVKLPEMVQVRYSVPTGPMIVLAGGGIALYALFFAPKRGLVSRYLRIAKFKGVCIEENLLKALWRLNQRGGHGMRFKQIAQKIGLSSPYLYLLLYRLVRQKAVIKEGPLYHLTPLGTKRGARIVRLHRLWEAYLVNSLGLKVERVHKSAEEMEHILTPELEKQLADLLDHPTQDPHDQPIPGG
jgi:manganese/zinc/iron transport system permease protein